MVAQNKIGIGLITCDRPDFYKKSVTSLLDAAQKTELDYIIINDGKEKLPYYPVIFKETKGKEGVAKAKNIALEYLLDQKCEHIFLMEDDIEILNHEIFEKYINASKSTGIKHFNYALHGNHNLNFLNQPNIRKSINYPDKTTIDLYPNVLGAFSYYHVDVLNKIGLMDENFYNALEHVDHTYQIIKNDYHPPFRWFADIKDSNLYLKDIVPEHQQSKIRSESDFQDTFKKGLDHFIHKNKFSVVAGYGPQENIASEQDVVQKLKEIWKLYHQE